MSGGPPLQPGLVPGIHLRRGLVDDAEDAAIRALLRQRPMAGAIRVALTREPDSRLAAAAEGSRTATVLLVGDDGLLAGFATRSVRTLYLGGKPQQVGYLGQLRLTDRAAGRRRLRQGFALLRDLRQVDEAPFDLTIIMDDNLPARRLLERGLPGLPKYHFLTELVTLVLPVRRRHVARGPQAVRRAEVADAETLRVFFETELRERPFAAVWRGEGAGGEGARRGPGVGEHWLLEEGGALVGTGAIWDQRAYRQAVVTGYAPALAGVRPLLNLGLGLLGQPLLPRPGTVLPLASVANFVVAGNEVERACRLVAALLAEARQRGLGLLALSLATRHPLAEVLRLRFHARPYRARLYAVAWPGDPLPEIPQELGFVEAGLL